MVLFSFTSLSVKTQVVLGEIITSYLTFDSHMSWLSDLIEHLVNPRACKLHIK